MSELYSLALLAGRDAVNYNAADLGGMVFIEARKPTIRCWC